MLIPKYWAKASQEVTFPKRALAPTNPVATIHCWRWSNISQSDAQSAAQTAIAERALALASGKRTKTDYPSKPVREEILQEFRGNDDQLIGAVTRSSLGFRVLNTANLAFVDVDFNRSKPLWILSFFKKKQSPADLRAQWEREAVERIESAYSRAQLSGRLYRTANGLRALVTSEKIHALDLKCDYLLSECDADELYKKLCTVQESFRARLSPKPRRLQLTSPGVKFPFENDADRKKIELWLADYENRQARFGTCEFLKRIGTNSTVPAEFKEIIEVHDRETKATDRHELK